MKTKMAVLMLMAGGALCAQTRFAFGIQIGRPAYAPVPVAAQAYRAPCPGPGYFWLDGYYDEFGNWYAGYWALPPYVGAYWIAPRFASGRFFTGYWTGPRGMYRAAPRAAARIAPPAYGREYERGFRDRGHVPAGPARGQQQRRGSRR